MITAEPSIYKNDSIYNGGGGSSLPDTFNRLSSLTWNSNAGYGIPVNVPITTKDEIEFISYLPFGTALQFLCETFFEIDGFYRNLQISTGNIYTSALNLEYRNTGGYYLTRSFNYDSFKLFQISAKKNVFIINGNSYSYSGTYEEASGVLKTVWGKDSYGSCVLPFLTFRVKDENGNFKFNSIPVENKDTSEIGIYDVVNGVFYPQGSNSFNKGLIIP